MTWLITSLRRLRDGPAVSLGLALVVGATAFVLALAPRLLDRTATEVLRSRVGAVAVDVRSLSIVEERRLVGSAGRPMTAVDEEGSSLAAQLPAGIARIAPVPAVAIDTPRWSVVSAVPSPSTIRFRILPGAESRLKIAEGRLPTAASRTIPVPPDRGIDGPEVLAVVEGILPQAAARTLDLHVGETVIAKVDQSDRFGSRATGAIAMDLVGTYTALDASDEWWFGDQSAFGPVLRNVGNNNSYNDATAILAPEAYPALFDALAPGGVPFRYTWRFRVDPSTLDSASLNATIEALRRAEVAFPSVPVVQGPQPLPSLSDGLLAFLRQYATRWSAASRVVSIVAVGPVLVALLALALVAMLVARRRRFALALAAGRGASPWQVAVSMGAEGLLLAIPSAAAGAIGAVLAAPGDGFAGGLVLAAAVAVIQAAFLVVACLPAASGQSATGGWREIPLRRVSPRRLALEGLLVVVAIMGTVLLRARGGVLVGGAGGNQAALASTTLGGATGASTGAIDPFAMAVPALLGLAGAVLAIRLFPLAMRLVAVPAALRRDLVPSLALRRVTRGAGSGPVLAVLLATSTVAAFASATFVHLDRVAAAAGWQAVGADFLVSATASGATGTKAGSIVSLPPQLDAGSLPGVEAAAPFYGGSVRLFPQSTSVQLLAVDPAAYKRVTAGTPAARDLPPGISEPKAGPIPALVSPDLPIGSTRPAVGDRFRVNVLSVARDFVVVGIAATFPSIEPGTSFLVVPLAPLRAAYGGTVAPTGAFLRAPGAPAAALRSALAATSQAIALESRAEVSATISESPFVGAVTSGVGAAAILAALYAALAMTAALAVSGAARAVEVGQLRTLGLTRRGVLGLALAEHGPTVGAAFAMGTALGFGIFVLLRPSLGLADLVGSAVEVPLAVDAAQLGRILLAMTAIAALGIGLAAALQGRAALALAIRRRAE